MEVAKLCRDKRSCLSCMGEAAAAVCSTFAAKKKSSKPSPRKASPTRSSSPSRRQLPPTDALSHPARQSISYEGTLLHAEPLPVLQVPAPKVRLLVMEDNQAVIKIVQKGRTPALRHLHRTHRINLDWITETCHMEAIELKYVGTTEQIADMMTKHFEPKKAQLLSLIHI